MYTLAATANDCWILDAPSPAVAAVMTHKEDDDESDHLVAVDSSDVDDAAQVVARLIEAHSKHNRFADAQPASSSLQLWQEIAPVLADLNREIQDEAHGRKERFRTQRLIRNRESLTGEAADAELDFLEEDDNVVVVFEHPDGSLYWVAGCIQYICTTAADIDIRKISDHELEVCAAATQSCTTPFPQTGCACAAAEQGSAAEGMHR